MPTIGELLKAKKSAPAHFEDLDVLWDTNVSDQIEKLEAEIESKEADKRLASDNGVQALRDRIADLRSSADTILTFRFRRMDGYAYAALCAKYPPRLDSTTDLNSGGYNIDEVARAAAKAAGTRVVDGKEEKLTDEDWDGLFKELSGHDVKQIRDVVWSLNEFGPAQQLALAKKALSDSTGS